MLADILPTSYEVGVLNGHVQPGDTVAVVGAGPIRTLCHSWSPALLSESRHRHGPRRYQAGGR